MGLLDSIIQSGQATKRNIRSLLDDPSGHINALLNRANENTQAHLNKLTGKPYNPTYDQAFQDAMKEVAFQAMFAGPKAANADIDALRKAQDMADKGISRDVIWQKTGWGKAPDGNWMWEIPDNSARWSPKLDQYKIRTIHGGDNIHAYGIDDNKSALIHPKLNAAYNEYIPRFTGDTSIDLFNMNNVKGTFGNSTDGIGQVFVKGSAWDDATKSTTLHELQHAIQQREGFARGGSPEQFTQQETAKLARDAISWRNELLKKRQDMPKADWMNVENSLVDDYSKIGAMEWLPSREARDLARQPNVLFADKYPKSEGGLADLEELVKAYGLDKQVTPYSSMDMYKRLAGETQARLTQARMNLTDAERRAIPPWSEGQYGYDVPENMQIVRFK